MEVLAFAGLPTVLFLEPPSPARLAQFAGLPRHRHRHHGALALARLDGPSTCRRSFRPARRLGAPVLHYKVCSTFDSAPEIGSIGEGGGPG